MLIVIIIIIEVSLLSVVQRLDNTIQRINRYPADNCLQNLLLYWLDSTLSGG